MELLKKAIIEKATVDNGVVKVGAFLNHEIDIALYREIGKEFALRFGQLNPTKILTVEASGIGLAVAAAMAMGDIPVVFAKKTKSKNLTGEKYSAKVRSFTKGIDYDVEVEKDRINSRDRIIIIDDFLAKGQAVSGLADIIDEAGATLLGVGIVIEKGWDDGGKLLRARGINLQSLVVIKSADDGKVVFE